jgi:hypothetical protein
MATDVTFRPLAYWLADDRAEAWDGQIVCRECERQIAEDATSRLPDPDADDVELEAEALADHAAVYAAMLRAGWTEYEIESGRARCACERCWTEL